MERGSDEIALKETLVSPDMVVKPVCGLQVTALQVISQPPWPQTCHPIHYCPLYERGNS